MKYMFLIYSPEDAWTPDEWTQCVVKSSGICHELAAKGEFIGASPLHPVATGSTVRVREGRKLITTGPFAETTEQLGGYYIIDVANLDEAIAIAGRLPPARKGTVEIRPLFPLEGVPSPKSREDLSAADPSLKTFMFLCYDDEEAWRQLGEQALKEGMQEAIGLAERIDAQGRFLSASPLRDSSTATSVRVRNEQRIVTDGPFAETREVMGGYYMILADSLDEAIKIAAEHPGARLGAVEVRQVFDVPPVPIPSPNEIMNTRDYSFSAKEIFAAFENGERLARWWGPAGFRNTFETFDFREGGEWKFVMHSPDGKDYPNHSRFGSISMNRIVIEHLSAPEFKLTTTLTELPGGLTRVVWRQAFESVSVRDQLAKFVAGANEQNFDRLGEELRKSS